MLFTAAGFITGNWSRVFGLLIVIVCLASPPFPSRQISSKQPQAISISREAHRSDAFEIRFDRPVLSNKMAEKRLNAWITEIVDDFSTESIANVAPGSGSGSVPNTLEERITRHRSRYPFLSLKFNIAENRGGANPETSIETFVFDMETGQSLDLTDLFARPGKALEFISRTAIQKLEHPSDHDLSPMARDRLLPAEQNFQYFSLDRYGITFFLPVYQTGTLALGEQRVTIPYARLNQWIASDIKDKL
jgi:hypothetical protein